MNHAIAVDASVAVKWVVLEPLSTQARALVADSIAARRPLLAPPHFSGEVTNALHQRWRSADPDKRLIDAEADAALAGFLLFQVEQRAPTGLYAQAAALARRLRLSSVYDALYVALAELESVELWTADTRLIRELGTRAPWVKALAGYPLPGQALRTP
ncbi:MAG TPA: type II toxin-antitoxin system VapC family toxin [Dehalococcoidia bacterium]|nr:type II toxin-antitoxin system VapC family toxin [Dehalococcoidia bacterium]